MGKEENVIKHIFTNEEGQEMICVVEYFSYDEIDKFIASFNENS